VGVRVGEGKTERLNPKESREAHVGQNLSNLMAKLNLRLTLQVFETFKGVYCKFLNFWIKIEKVRKLHGLKVNFPLYIVFIL
jgi:hypothetical protein